MPNLRLPHAIVLLAIIVSAGLPLLLHPSVNVYAASTTFRPSPIATSSPDLPGPLRGLYDYNMRQEAPVGSFDTYIRYSWRELELSEGVYNFALIDKHLEEARANGKRHGFRVRAMSSTNGVLVPDYIKDRMAQGWWADADKNGMNDTYVPDWNDPAFLNGFDRLMAALAGRYRQHPDLAFIDIGGYGNYGEFHTAGFSTPTSAAQPATSDSILRLVDAHLNAFNPDDPDGPRLIMMTDDPDALRYALERSPRIGWRRDSLGASSFTESGAFQQSWTEPLRALLFANRWKTAPVVTEFITPARQTIPATYQLAQQQARDYHVSLVSNGNTKPWDSIDDTGRQLLLDLGEQAGYRFELDELTFNGTLAPGGAISIATRWENNGNAPAYEPWVAYVQLRAAGQVLLEAPLYVDPQTLLPTNGMPISVVDALTLPATLGGGVYDVHVQIRDPRGYRRTLPLAIAGQQSDGSYHLGQITLSGATVSLPPFNPPTPTCTTRQFYGDSDGRYGQTSEASYVAGTTFTLVDQSSSLARGLVVTASNNETQLSWIGATFSVLSTDRYRIGLYSQNNNVSSQWVKLKICTPPSPTVAPTATFTPFPVSPVATRTPTPTIGPCVVVRYNGDGDGQYGEYKRDSYQAGTTLTLVARSSLEARAVYWITNQSPAFLGSVDSQATIVTANYYNLGFESKTKNLSSEWVEVRLCPPGSSAPPATTTPSSTAPTSTAVPSSCTTRRYYGDGSGTWGQLTKLQYAAGTTFTLTARSSSAVGGVYWIDGQHSYTLSTIDSTHTTQWANVYYLGFQSSTENRTTAWADLRTCLPRSAVAAALGPTGEVQVYLPIVQDGFDDTPFDSSTELERDTPPAGLPTGEADAVGASVDAVGSTVPGASIAPTPTSTPPAAP